MKTGRISLRRLALPLIFVTVVAAFVFPVALPNLEGWSYARRLSNALTRARSVEIVEFDRDWAGPVSDDQQTKTLPESWREPLALFFTAAGMPPREDYTELSKNHPDYHLIEEAWNRIDGVGEAGRK